MNTCSAIRNWHFYNIIPYVLLFIGSASAQKKNITELPSDVQYQTSATNAAYEKDERVGSSYLSDRWMRGTIILWDHKKIPASSQYILCNFDKIKNIIYVVTDTNKILSYPIDSVLSFELDGNNKTYSFEKVQWISSSFYLMPVFTSVTGYSLYKRLITKVIQADFSNGGYFTNGKKYDEYADRYEYYLIYPGNQNFEKLLLKEKIIRRALKAETNLVNEFFSLHENEINEQSLLGLIQYIDDKKFPD